MSFLLILLSGVFDVFANLALVKSNGFKNVKFGILSLFLVSSAFVFLAFSIELGMKLPIAYTLWGGIGIFGSVLGGYYFFKQTLKPIGYFGVILIIISVAILQFK